MTSLDLIPVSFASATVQTDGLWLIGVGAMLLTVVGLAAAPLRLHLQFGGLGDSRQDRLAFTGTGLGLLATAVGSLLVAVGSTPATMFIIRERGVPRGCRVAAARVAGPRALGSTA